VASVVAFFEGGPENNIPTSSKPLPVRHLLIWQAALQKKKAAGTYRQPLNVSIVN
jgi:hypothetical protein